MSGPRGTRGRRARYSQTHAISEAMNRAIRVDLLRGVRTFKQNIDVHDIATAFSKLPRNPTEKHLQQVIKTVSWERMEKDLRPAMARLGSVASTGATETLRELPFANRLKYSVHNPRMARYLDQRTGHLITTSEQGMLEAVRAATTRAFTHGLSPLRVAQELRGSIGLNAPQARALANYRASLLAAETPKSPRQIDELASAYEERLLDQRSVMIARTEVRFAQNEGQQDVWEAAEDQGLLPEDAGRIWVVDGNPCPKICKLMDGKRTGLREPWILPDRRAVQNPTEAHPNCYCIASLDF